MATADMVRPRWGTYSTRGHLDKAALTIDLLLYDKLIFPVPRDDAVDDWVQRGWAPQLQDDLLIKLGDELAYRAIWEGELQDEFRAAHAQMKQELRERAANEGEDSRRALERIASEIAYPATALLLVAAANRDPMFVANEPIPPIAVAAFQSEAEAEAACLLRRIGVDAAEGVRKSGLDLAALFTRKLAVPKLDEYSLDDAFDRVLELVKDPNYRQARRALYHWEQEVIRDRWSVERARAKLIESAQEHDELVKRAFRDRWITRGLAVASVVVPPVVGLLADWQGFLGSMAAAGLIGVAQAKLPKVADPYAQPGAALSMAIDAVWKL